MISNLEKYKKDLERLISEGILLSISIRKECYPEEFEKENKKGRNKKEYDNYVTLIPRFSSKYQNWYSESIYVLRQILPERLPDFVKLYEKPKNRKLIEYGNYVIEDYLQGLSVTTGFGERKVGPEAAISQFDQQLNIIRSVKNRFESSLFDIKQLIQADLFDSEIEAAKELNKKGFIRGAGAIAGVVLEKHLTQVCDNHKIKISKKNPTISDLNDSLKAGKVIETPTWRKIQHLSDIRNLCDHNKKREPQIDEINEFIEGVEKFIKTLF
jgi:hypothetical protein